MSAVPATASVTAGQTATFALALAPSNGFKAPVSFTCKGLPAGAACNFSPASLNVATPSNVGLSISTTAATHARLRTSRLLFAFYLPLFGVAFAGSRSRRKILLLALVLLLAVGIIEIGCGGGTHAANVTPNSTTPTQASQSATPAGTYTVTVVATSGSMQHTTAVQLVVK